MSSEYEIIIVPRDTANDNTVVLVEWLVNDGEEVSADQAICIIESSKAAVEIPACCDGWLFHLASQGQELPIGCELAVVSVTENRPEIEKNVFSPKVFGDMKITRKAQLLMAEHDLGPDDFEGQGVEILRERHVREFLESKRKVSFASAMNVAGRFEKASHVQNRTAKILAQSKAEIPHSYLVAYVDAEAVDVIMLETGHEHDAMISVSDRLVWCVSKMMKDFSKANSAWQDDGIYYFDEVNVGFALNLSSGELVVPVIRNACDMDIVDIAGAIRGMQKKAIRHKLSPVDLTGGTISVTSMTGSGVHQVYPIIYPGQGVIVSIGDKWSYDGGKIYSICVAFDHRVMNGAEAGEFLKEVARRMITHE